jgi:glycosyltransferase involved in cell wall biosynthesis
MMISVVTPSRNNSEWLKLCVASVADQAGPFEHIVQDGGSTDGTLQWLLDDSRVQARSERDRSMYEAINRGLARARGDVLGYLNCDEQYLPGALEKVRRYFAEHPEVEIVFGDAVVVEADGNFICYRKTVTPQLLHTWVNGNLSIFTCATFFRRSILERGLFFDPDVRMVGDTEWLLQVIRSGARMGLLREYTSAFTMTGRNIGFTQEARREHEQFYGSAPAWARTLKKPIIWHHWLRRWWNGAYQQGPFSYSIYTKKCPSNRTTFQVKHPSFRWRGAGYVEGGVETRGSERVEVRSTFATLRS